MASIKIFWALLCREWKIFWLTSISYISGIALLATSGYFLSGYMKSYRERFEQFQAGFLPGNEVPNIYTWVIEPYSETISFFLVFILPILTVRVFSDEKRIGSLQMILLAPIKPFWIVGAKFFSTLLSVSLLLLFLIVPVFYLLLSLNAPLYPLLGVVLSLALFSCFAIALGCAISQSVKHSISGILMHLTLLLILYFAHTSLFSFDLLGFSLQELISPTIHSTRINQGLFSAYDIGFFISASMACLFYTVGHLNQETRL